jgi:hypothetical protein
MSGGLIAVVGLIVVIALGLILVRKLREDKIESLLKKRRNVARVSQIALYVEGPSQVPVALTLTKSMLFYENEDLQASLELARINEVEYDDDVSTAQSSAHGRVLRLRSHGQVFEFILRKEKAAEFEEHLPAHHIDQPGGVQVV